MGVIFSHVIGCMKKPAIRQEITSVTMLLRLGKLLYLLYHVAQSDKVLFMSVLFAT